MAERRVLVCDVCGRLAQESVTFRIGNRALAKDLCQTHVGELVRNARAPRRGRQATAPVLPGAKARRGARPPVSGKRAGSGKRGTAERPHRRITDPAILEKRRAALEKARKALAKKRAAANKAG